MCLKTDIKKKEKTIIKKNWRKFGTYEANLKYF